MKSLQSLGITQTHNLLHPSSLPKELGSDDTRSHTKMPFVGKPKEETSDLLKEGSMSSNKNQRNAKASRNKKHKSVSEQVLCTTGNTATAEEPSSVSNTFDALKNFGQGIASIASSAANDMLHGSTDLASELTGDVTLPTTPGRVARATRRASPPTTAAGTGGSPYQIASPMARMRASTTRRASTGGVPAIDSSPAKKTPKSQEQIKAEKQRKWKKQIKLANRKKIQEQRALEGTGGRAKTTTTLEEGVMDARELVGAILTSIIPSGIRCGSMEYVARSESEFTDSDASIMTPDPTSESFTKTTRKALSYSFSEATATGTPERASKPRSKPETDSEASSPSRNSSLGTRSEESNDSEESEGRVEEMSPARTSCVSGETTDGQFLSSRIEASKKSSPSGSPARSENSGASDSMDPRTKNFVRAFISDLVSDGLTLLWHKEQADLRPCATLVCLKPGYQMPSCVHCGPRLVWADTNSPHEAFGVNLFDIGALERADSGHLKDYPYAMARRSIFLTTVWGQDFLFEALSEDAAFRFIHGMRWIIARLSFNLVIGNSDVSSELLELKSQSKPSQTHSPRSVRDDAESVRAMDDVTFQLVDRLSQYREL